MGNRDRDAEKPVQQMWPAAGFVDTVIGCCMKPEVAFAECVLVCDGSW